MSFLSLAILIPSYTILHDSKFSFILNNIYPMDTLTLSDSLQNPQVVTVVVLFTVLYTILAYYCIYKFSSRMSLQEFTP